MVLVFPEVQIWLFEALSDFSQSPSLCAEVAAPILEVQK